MEGSRRGAVVLIIGATGYTGQFVVKHFLEEQDKEPSSTRFTIHATYHLAAPSSRATIDSRIHWHCVDFASDAIKEHARQLVTTCKPDVIINVAALSSAPQCQKNPALAWKVNCPKELLEVIVEAPWQPYLVHVSTDIVYGTDMGVFDEHTQAIPVNVYGETKLAFDDLVKAQLPTRSVILRASNILGPLPPYDPSRKKFVQWLQNEVDDAHPKYRQQEWDPIKLFSDELRCYVSVYDVVEAISKLTMSFVREQGASIPVHLILGGGPEALTRVELTERLLNVFGYSRTSGGDKRPKYLSVKRSEVALDCPAPVKIVMKNSHFEQLLGRKPKSVVDIFHDLAGNRSSGT